MSYNAVVQKASLEGRYELQETPVAASAAVDQSGKGRDGTYENTTQPAVVAGPTSYLPNANQFYRDDFARVRLPNPGYSLSGGTYIMWIRRPTPWETGLDNWSAPICFRGRFTLHTSRNSFVLAHDWSGSEWSNSTGYNSLFPDWTVLALTVDTADGFARFYVNGTEVHSHYRSSQESNSVISSSTAFVIGQDPQSANDRYVKGELANVAFFSEALTLAEIQEYGAGPEPLQTVAGSLTTNGTDLLINTGSWDSQLNGAVVDAWEIRRASDNALIQSGSGNATYTPVADDFYAIITGTNDGGRDSLQDQTTGVISVGGGGPSFDPWFSRRSSRLIGGGV